MTITYRMTKGSSLTYPEMDENFRDLREDTDLDRVLENGNTSTRDMTVNNITATGNLNITGTVVSGNTVHESLNVESYLYIGDVNVAPTLVSAYDTANNAYSHANTTNTYLQGSISTAVSDASSYTDAANTYLITVIDGANTAVGTGANSYTDAANTYLTDLILGVGESGGGELGAANVFLQAYADTVGENANTYTDAANTYLTDLILGVGESGGGELGAANVFLQAYADDVGTSANAYTDAANTYLKSVISGANTAVGAGANSYTDAANTYLQGVISNIDLNDFTGTVTFDTNTLYIDSINHRVGIGTITPGAYKLDVNGSLNTTSFYIGGTQVTATAAELNILDGVTATAAELNKLDGVTATTTELNYVDGVTSSIQTQLNTKLASASYTAADVLSKLLTVDGSGTGLDADLWDGNQFASYLNQAVLTSSSPSFSGLTVDTNTLYVDATNNRVGIGTLTPATSLSVLGTVIASTSETNSTAKQGLYGVKHYTNAEEPFYGLHLYTASGVNSVYIGGGTSGGNAATDIRFYTAANATTPTGSPRMYIDSAGNVGIGTGTTSPSVKTEIVAGTTAGTSYNTLLLNSGAASTVGSGSKLYLSGGGGVSRASMIEGVNTGGGNNGHDMVFYTSAGSSSPSERMRINSAGNVGIGKTPSYKLDVNGTVSATSYYVDASNYITTGGSEIRIQTASGRLDIGPSNTSYCHFWTDRTRYFFDHSLTVSNTGGNYTLTSYLNDDLIFSVNSGGTEVFRVSKTNQNMAIGTSTVDGGYRLWVDGDVRVIGTLQADYKNFRISHPLPSLSKTHDLVHSSIEGPNADLLYRGRVDLVSGQATVNIDTASRMTEGTFEVLNMNVQCFVTNETGWSAVKGSVSGNILTITSQDITSNDTISWLVIGERMFTGISTKNIGEDGRLIVESLTNKNS